MMWTYRKHLGLGKLIPVSGFQCCVLHLPASAPLACWHSIGIVLSLLLMLRCHPLLGPLLPTSRIHTALLSPSRRLWAITLSK